MAEINQIVIYIEKTLRLFVEAFPHLVLPEIIHQARVLIALFANQVLWPSLAMACMILRWVLWRVWRCGVDRGHIFQIPCKSPAKKIKSIGILTRLG
jgi:hypothetical protein